MKICESSLLPEHIQDIRHTRHGQTENIRAPLVLDMAGDVMIAETENGCSDGMRVQKIQSILPGPQFHEVSPH